jgi:ATPase subunit of ABC transporter with duplicated ATPase domains
MVQIDPVDFEKVNYTKWDEIVTLFPLYKRQQLASKKPLPKSVHIENFTMKTPYGDQVLMQRTDLIIEPHRRQCLIGPNCSGKTLLFHNIVSGKIPEFPTHLHVHHCRELETHELGETVIDTVVNSNPYRNTLFRLEAKLKDLAASATEEKKSSYIANLELVQAQINALQGYTTRERAEKMLRVLGFDETGQQKLVSALSGGLRMRVALAIAFINDVDLLLLDEPTNHLDFPSVLWLENRLRGFKGSFLLVSHDRELLKNVCTSVMLLEDKEIKYYHTDFEQFEKKKALEDTKKYDEIEKFLLRNKNADPSTPVGRQVLDKRTWSKTFYEKRVAMITKFTFPAPVELDQPEGAAPVPQEEVSLVNLQNVRFSYNPSAGHFIFNTPISFNVKASTRVGVMGPNGAGKSTFLKLLTHKLQATEGTVTPHPKYTLAYFGQHSTAELDLETNAIEFMMNSFPDANPAHLRQHLAKTGIVGNVADTRVSGLSYSQRSCIVFAKLTFQAPHLLILDEPTNFLDLESVDSLISACNKYKGALLLVSHNRDFLKKCAKQYLSIVPGRFELYNDMKTAEKATYTFIEDMEGGQAVGHKDMLVNNPGGGSVHSSQKVVDGVISPVAAAAVATANTTPSTPAPVATPTTTTTTVTAPRASTDTAQTATVATAENVGGFNVGDKVQAKYTGDGKWYKAVIKAVKGNIYQVHYSEYGNAEFVPFTSVRKLDRPAHKTNKPKKDGKQGGAKKVPHRPQHQNNNSSTNTRPAKRD